MSMLGTGRLNSKTGSWHRMRAGIQRARFLDSRREVLFITLSRPFVLMEGTDSSVTLDLLIDDKLKQYARFLDDPSIPLVEVNQSCERCTLPKKECLVRVAPTSVQSREKKTQAKLEALKRFSEALQTQTLNLVGIKVRNSS